MSRNSAKAAQPSWSSQLIALTGLFGIGALIAYIVPSIPNSTSGVFSNLKTINFHQLLALVLISAVMVIFLAYYRAKLFFSTRWLIAVVVYNFLILFVKFTLSTNGVTNSTSKDFTSLLSTALLVWFLYAFAFFILYLFFSGKLLNRALHKALITSTEGKVLLAMGLFILASLARIIMFRLPVLSTTNTSSYLGDLFKANTALLSMLIFVMIIAAVEAYAQVRRHSDLKYFFLTGVFLMLMFHIWWAIFVYRGY